MNPALSVLLKSTSLSLKRRQVLKSRISILSFGAWYFDFYWNRRLILVFVYRLSSGLCVSGSSRRLLFVYWFSSALCCFGLNRCRLVVPLSFLIIRMLRKHRTLSASIGLTACPLTFMDRLLLLLLALCGPLVRVDHISWCRLLVDVNHSLYQHLLEVQCAVQNMFNKRVTDRG